MKSTLIKIALSFVLVFLYTYAVIYYTTARMIKNEVINSTVQLYVIKKLLQDDKKIDNFIDAQINMNLSLYEADFSLFKNSPIALYLMLFEENIDKNFCNTILHENNNLVLKNFIEKRCKENEKLSN